MRDIVDLLALLAFVRASRAQIDSNLEHPRCRDLTSTSCVELISSDNGFYYEVNGCQILMDFSDKKHFFLQCESHLRIATNNPELPVMPRLVEVEKVIIKGCFVPDNGSYRDALMAMNVTMTHTSTLYLRELPADPNLENRHLRGLQISGLTITSNQSGNLLRPTVNYLDGILGLRSLALNGMILDQETLMLLPDSLGKLSLEHTGLLSAGNDGSEWLGRLQSLQFLYLVESSDAAAKAPGIQLSLPKLVSLPKLTNLTLHHVPLNSNDLASSLRNSFIKHLVLVSCGLNNLPNNLFQGVNLTSLILAYDDFTISDDVLSPLQWLTELDLSNNNLKGEELSRIILPLAQAQMETLKANENPLGSVCGDSVKVKFQLPRKLCQLELRSTQATRICPCWMENDALMNIDLSGNDIGDLTYNDIKMKRKVNNSSTSTVVLNLADNPKLRVIRISSLDLKQCHSLQFIEDSNYRTGAWVELNLDTIACDCEAYWLREALNNNCSLLKLKSDVKCLPQSRVSRVHTSATLLGYDVEEMLCPYSGFCLPECSCWKRPRDNATVVQCEAELPRLPRWPPAEKRWPLVLHVSPGTIRALPDVALLELHAPNNNITILDNMDISETLLVLDVRHNNIHHISEAAAKKLSAVASRSILLSGNQFACTCSDAPAFQMLSRVVSDWNSTKCADDSYVSEKTESELCASLLAPGLGLATFILILITMGLLLRRFHLKVRKVMFKYNICVPYIISVKDNVSDPNKTHDAFLSYAYKDLEQLTELKNGLEDRGYKTLDHCRDWQPGEAVKEQITRSVLCARRTLLLVSDNYAESKWALEEFHAAHSHALEQRTARVVIIRYSLTKPENLPSDLQLYLKYTTYLDWHHENFWYKLYDFMPPLARASTLLANG